MMPNKRRQHHRPMVASEPLVIDLEQLDIVDSAVSQHAGPSGGTETLVLSQLTLRKAGKEDRIEARLRFRESPGARPLVSIRGADIDHARRCGGWSGLRAREVRPGSRPV